MGLNWGQPNNKIIVLIGKIHVNLPNIINNVS